MCLYLFSFQKFVFTWWYCYFMFFGCPSENLYLKIYAYFVVPFMPSTNLAYLSLMMKVGTCLLVSFWNFLHVYILTYCNWWSSTPGLMYSFQISSLHWVFLNALVIVSCVDSVTQLWRKNWNICVSLVLCEFSVNPTSPGTERLLLARTSF